MSSEDIWLLTSGLIAVLVVAVLTLSTRRAVALGALIIAIPFQVVTSRYASSSVLMAYAVAGLLLMSGALKPRMLPALGLIVFAYLASLSQASQFLKLHMIEIFQFGSCLVMFLLAYNYARLVKEDRAIVDTLMGMNALVIVYCALQLYAGAGNAFVPFGIETLAFNFNRDPSDARLVGPFANPATTAGYFTLMTLICVVELIFASRIRRRLLQVLIVANVGGILATANRGGFLVLLAAFPAILLFYRHELGARRVTQYLVGGIAAFALASSIVIAYTDFGNMFSRLGAIEVTEEGIPMTRAGTWPPAIEKIKRDPWFGEGPHFINAEDAEMLGIGIVRYEDLSEMTTTFDPYPHSMYLFLLRTVGFVGLCAVMWFFARVSRSLYVALRRHLSDPYRQALLKLGLLVIVAFLTAQITIEFNRPTTMDYAQFIFALMGLFVGIGDRDRPVDQASQSAALAGQLPARASASN